MSIASFLFDALFFIALLLMFAGGLLAFNPNLNAALNIEPTSPTIMPMDQELLAYYAGIVATFFLLAIRLGLYSTKISVKAIAIPLCLAISGLHMFVFAVKMQTLGGLVI